MTGSATVLAASFDSFSVQSDSLNVVADDISSTLMLGTENEIDRFGFGSSSDVSLYLDYLAAEVEDELLVFEVSSESVVPS